MTIWDVGPVQKQEFIHLTTKGRKTGKPHTVELWFAFAEGAVYLSHEGRATDWMMNLLVDNLVSFRIGKASFEGLCRIAVGASRERGKKALYEKYYGPATKEVLDDWFSLSKVIEISQER